MFSRRFYTLVSPEELMHGAEFRKHLANLFRKRQEEKKFRPDFNPQAAASALWGALQGMMRDKFYAEGVKEFPNHSFENMRVVLRAIIEAFVETVSDCE